MNRGFGSDNHSGVHPEIFKALISANLGHAPSYGTDNWSEQAEKAFQLHFGNNAKVFYVFNGTASNALALTAMAKSYESVLCSDVSHISVDECAAPEFFFRGKLIPIACKDGKLIIEDLEPHLIRGGDQHYSQPRVLSLTQPTELGTVYSFDELKTLCTWAKQKRLLIHLDGTRISNAALKLGLSFKEFTTELGIDVVSFGGTKNGLMFGEALVFLNPALAENFKFIRKQCGQLPSKSRFLAASFARYLTKDLWLEIARHECAMAERLHHGLEAFPQIKVTRPCDSNAVFAEIPQKLIKKLREDFFFYVWNEKTFECRLMTSWDTEVADVDAFLQKIRSLL
jgi:threonine aldolase